MDENIKRVTGDAYFQEINDMLTRDECKELIRISEQKGYRSTQRNKYNDEIDNPAIRSDDHVSLTDAAVTKLISSRIGQTLPEKMNGMSLIGLQTNFKFNRYSTGQDFRPHNDTCLVRNRQQSRLTMMIYLNADFTGGQTRFFEIETMNHIDVTPETGKAVIFDQDLYHAGLKVNSGIKYTVRLDVMYGTRPTKQPRRLSCKSRSLRRRTSGRFTHGRRD